MYSTSREKLSQMHEALDRELEMAVNAPKQKTKREKDTYRFVPETDDNKKSTLTNISNKPVTYDHEVRETDIKSKKNQISELERKLMELQRKMDNFSVSSGEESQEEVKGRLNLKQKLQSKPNQDTARFLVDLEQKERVQTKFSADYPSIHDEEEEEDSEQYFQIQQAIQKRKADQRLSNSRQKQEREQAQLQMQVKLTSNSNSRSKRQASAHAEDTDRKVSVETEGALKPKYVNNQRSNRSVKDKKSSKNSVRDSVVSKRSVEKAKPLLRENSKGSLRSGHSVKKGSKRGMNESLQRSFDRSEGEVCLRGEQIELAKEAKRVGNLEKQIQHYKRLAKKLGEQVEGYKIMQIEFRQLKKNFAKSEAIRGQQKRIIESLKAKMGR